MQRQKCYALIFCAILIGCSLTSCTDETNKSERRVISATESQINVHPVEDLKNGGTLRLPLANFPDQWNYYHAQGGSAETRLIENALLPRAFYFDVDGKPARSADYFEDIALSVNNDVQTVTYKIHPKAHWSNGEPITWRDIEATWKANNQSNPEFQTRFATGWRDISSVVQGGSEREAVVQFGKKFADWKSLFSPFYPASLYQHPQQFNTAWINNLPLTSGLFKLQRIDDTAGTIIITRNDSWWGERPKLDSVTFTAFAEDTDIEAYLNQELDVLETRGDVNRYSLLKDATDTDFRTAASATYNYIAFNSSEILEDSETRIALTKAINRQLLFDTQYRGMPYAAQPLNNHFFLTSDPRYQDNTKSIANYNIAKAKRELDEAGWITEDNTTRSREGKKLTLRLVIREEADVYQHLAELIQNQLEGAQAEVEIIFASDDDSFKDYIQSGNFDLALLVASNTGYPNDLYDMFQTEDSHENYERIGTEEIVEGLKEAEETLDQDRHVELLNGIDEKVWQEGHSLPLSQLPQINAVRPALANYGAAVGFVDINWSKVGWLRDEVLKTRP